MLSPIWQKLSLLNPSVYLISGFRWSFFDRSEVSLGVSFAMTSAFFAIALAISTWILRTAGVSRPDEDPGADRQFLAGSGPLRHVPGAAAQDSRVGACHNRRQGHAGQGRS
jgi:hypothetical protein